jgi:hypothetical protein
MRQKYIYRLSSKTSKFCRSDEIYKIINPFIHFDQFTITFKYLNDIYLNKEVY